jgi:hypothetical protein
VFVVGLAAPASAQDTPLLINGTTKGPQREKRPADVNARAVMIAKIAMGEIDDVTTHDGKNATAVALDRMGGKARAKSMTAKRRKEIAQKAARERWRA